MQGPNPYLSSGSTQAHIWAISCVLCLAALLPARAALAADNKVPTLNSLSPSSRTAGGAAFTLTVNGTNFVSGSVVRWNGADRTTTYGNPSRLTAAIPASDVAVAGTAQVTVFNPPPGGGTSAARTFTINNPVPTITNLAPSGAQAGSAGFTLTVNGTQFVAGSVVRWNGTNRTTAFVSSSQLTAAIPSSDLTAAGSAQVTVFNPSPGGGTSTAKTFSIRTPDETPGPSLGTATTVSMNALPSTAEIVFLFNPLPFGNNKQIFTMDRYGANMVQITIDNARQYEHVAISRDRRFMAASEHFDVMLPPKLWIFDLQKRTEAQVAPQWISAGFGGVDWDVNGYLYFGGLAYNQPQGGTSNYNDLYRMKYDGTGLQRIVRSDQNNEGDVDVSDDSGMIAYTKEFLIGQAESYTEIWKANTDGTNPVMVIQGGIMGISNIQNPAFSPDGSKIVFDRKNNNPGVPPNFPTNPAANSAYDLWIVESSGGLMPPDPNSPNNPTDPSNPENYAVRLTLEGPISIVPSWKYFASGLLQGNLIVYLEVCECSATSNPFAGTSIVYDSPAGTQEPIRIRPGAQAARWIP